MSAFPSDAGRIQKVIDAHTPRIKELRRAAVQARRASFRLLSAPDYTPAKMAAVLDALHTADTALEAESLAMMNDSLTVLTPDERAVLVEKIKRRNRSWLFRMFRPRPGD
jgi:Spy/CpxP family protein refolding chaperone